jgi:hypothetical protein
MDEKENKKKKIQGNHFSRILMNKKPSARLL